MSQGIEWCAWEERHHLWLKIMNICNWEDLLIQHQIVTKDIEVRNHGLPLQVMESKVPSTNLLLTSIRSKGGGYCLCVISSLVSIKPCHSSCPHPSMYEIMTRRTLKHHFGLEFECQLQSTPRNLERSTIIEIKQCTFTSLENNDHHIKGHTFNNKTKPQNPCLLVIWLPRLTFYILVELVA